jgi:selenide,water dikinase
MTPPERHIVLIGAGYAHLEVLRSFGIKPQPGVRLTLLTRQAETPYSGMQPGLIAGLYAFEDVHIGIRPLCRFAGARLILDEAVGIDLAERRVLCADAPPIPFDILSIDTGSGPNTQGVPGARKHAIALKPIDGFLARLEIARQRVLNRRGAAKICVVGAGAAGVELMLAIERRLRRDIEAAGYDSGRAAFSLVSADPDILMTYPRRVRARFSRILTARGIAIKAGAPVASVESGAVRLKDGDALFFDEIFWAVEASAASWLTGTGLKLDALGFIEVAPTLESVSEPLVFAAGDVASFRGCALPKAGVHAVREGPVLAENMRRAASGKPLKTYRPQRHILSLISTGERYAIGSRNGLSFEGAWVWRWKDWIDRRYMDQFKNLLAHSPPR